MDALGHMSAGGRLHGGADAAEAARGGWGLKSHSIAEVDPVVSEGVLLDIEAVRGRPLGAGEVVTVEDLRAAAERAQVVIGTGDTVLVRTGWSRHWADAETFVGERGGSPGPDLEAARWLVDQGAWLTGSDTMVYEASSPDSHALPVHAFLLVERGINIMEMLNLDELAREGVHRFLFVATPLKLVGSTGSPLRPIALA
jgi:kynurenine formamidase